MIVRNKEKLQFYFSSLTPYTQSISKCCWLYLQNIYRIWPVLTTFASTTSGSSHLLSLGLYLSSLLLVSLLQTVAPLHTGVRVILPNRLCQPSTPHPIRAKSKVLRVSYKAWSAPPLFTSNLCDPLGGHFCSFFTSLGVHWSHWCILVIPTMAPLQVLLQFLMTEIIMTQSLSSFSTIALLETTLCLNNNLPPTPKLCAPFPLLCYPSHLSPYNVLCCLAASYL